MRKTLLITGATGGIGSALVNLSKDKYDLILVGRSKEKIQRLHRALLAKYPQTRIYEDDLSLISGAKRLIAQLENDHVNVDFVIQAAGKMNKRFGETSEGIEQTLAIQVVVKYCLIYELARSKAGEHLSKTIIIAGGGIGAGKVKIENLQKWQGIYHPVLATIKSSLLDDLATQTLIKNTPEVHHYNYGPGIVKTDLGKDLGLIYKLGLEIAGAIIGRTPESVVEDLLEILHGNLKSGHYTRGLEYHKPYKFVRNGENQKIFESFINIL